jgi:DnaK suppressor protein
MLLQKKREITQEIEDQLDSHLSDELQRRIDSALDEGDQSLLDLTEDIDLSLLEMRNKTLKDIHNALRCLKDGTYGICEECQGPIPEKRLRVMPFVRTCVTCQEKREVLEKIEKEEDRFK